MARTAKSGVTHLDTHVVCWLYEGRTELLTSAAMRAIEDGLLQVSPMVQLELTYLHEIGRTGCLGGLGKGHWLERGGCVFRAGDENCRRLNLDARPV